MLRDCGLSELRLSGSADCINLEPMGAPTLYPGGFGVVLMFLLMTLVTPVEATAGTVAAILLGTALARVAPP